MPKSGVQPAKVNCSPQLTHVSDSCLHDQFGHMEEFDVHTLLLEIHKQRFTKQTTKKPKQKQNVFLTLCGTQNDAVNKSLIASFFTQTRNPLNFWDC